MIHGVRVKQLKVNCDERGRLMEILRCDDPEFIKFGQLYMTTAYPGVVKGWHYHKKQIDSFAVVKGMIKLVLFDAREKSKTHQEVNEFFLGEHNPILVQIPNFVFHGFKCVSETEAIVINCPTEPYRRKEPDEFRAEHDDPSIPYNWEIQLK
jgi:dTDP-4-dehydrorhamnose 3,5-epimerase